MKIMTSLTTSSLLFIFRLQEMEILYKKEKEEADLLLEQQRLVCVLTSD